MEAKQWLAWAALAGYFALMAFIEGSQRRTSRGTEGAEDDHPRGMHRARRNEKLGPSLVLLRPALAPQQDSQTLLRPAQRSDSTAEESLCRPA
jgi:hypothetical protein